MYYLESDNSHIDKKIIRKCNFCGQNIDWSKQVAINFKEQFFCKDCFLEEYTWRPLSTAKNDANAFKSAGRWSEARWLTEPFAFVPFEDKYKDKSNPKYELYWKSRIIDIVEEFLSIKSTKTIASIMIRANHFVKTNGFTFKGIYYSLLYHYKIKKGDPKKAKNNIGIVPFIYREATEYWIRIFQSAERKNKKIQEFAKEEQSVKYVVYQGAEFEIKRTWKDAERAEQIKEFKEELGKEYDEMQKILLEMRKKNE